MYFIIRLGFRLSNNKTNILKEWFPYCGFAITYAIKEASFFFKIKLPTIRKNVELECSKYRYLVQC